MHRPSSYQLKFILGAIAIVFGIFVLLHYQPIQCSINPNNPQPSPEKPKIPATTPQPTATPPTCQPTIQPAIPPASPQPTADSSVPAATIPACPSDAFQTPFHYYFHQLSAQSPKVDIAGIPLAHKWIEYFDAYHNHFKKYRGKPVTFLEIGLQSGGSLAMWRWYFGDQLKYIGIDIAEHVLQFKADWNEILLGDTGSEAFWKNFTDSHPGLVIDIVLDDGGHLMKQQLTAFNVLFPLVEKTGIYACEDLHTSYLPAFGGRNTKSIQNWNTEPYAPNTYFTDMIKLSVDYLHGHWIGSNCATHVLTPKITCTIFQEAVKAIYLYESIVLWQKGAKIIRDIKAGSYVIPYVTTGVSYPKNSLTMDQVGPKINKSIGSC